MTKIIVGVDDSERAADAVALGSVLAETAGADLLIAHAYPFEVMPSHVGLPDRERRCREHAVQVVERRLDPAAGVIMRPVPLAGGSPARQLQALAEREGAAAIVIASSHRGELGRVFAGMTAERLLHGAPCPVVVAPRGYTARALHTILVGHDGGAEAQGALEAVRAWGARVRLVRVFEPAAIGVQAAIAGAWIPPVGVEADAREAFEREFAGLGDAVEREFVVGDAVGQLVSRTEEADLAIVGSRGYGPLRSVLLGSVSGRLVRRAACPVMVVPRGTASGAAALLGARTTTALCA